MSYYLRYFATEKKEVTLPLAEKALKDVDASYAIEEEGDGESGHLTYKGELYGLIEINRLGDSLFEEERREMIEFLEEAEDKQARNKVLKVLQNTRATIVVQVLFQGRETEETLSKLDPLWNWLHANYSGLLQADGEGYYDSSGLVLAEA